MVEYKSGDGEDKSAILPQNELIAINKYSTINLLLPILKKNLILFINQIINKLNSTKFIQ